MADDVTSSLAGKVVDLLIGVAKKEIGYMWNFSENVKTFKEEVDKLTAMKDTLQGRIEYATREGKDPGKDLIKWINDANDMISKATKLINEEDESKKTCCNLRFCVNLGTLYRYGKTTTKETSSLQKQQQDGEGFKNYVFDPLPTPGFIDLYQPKDLENMDTQKSTLKTIIQAVKDIQIVGIVGLGGVGKTTLANEVSAKVKNQFDYIEFIVVSQDLVKEKIKEKIEVAAKRIINGQKVLIILDDVWNEFELDEVGIPCGSRYMNCKILLTSRIKDVCKAMNATVIELNPLKEKEAWSLFEQVVGEREWDDTLKQVALGIVEECGGLPLFIQAVGKALKDREIISWQAALDRLRDPTDEDAPFKRKGIMQLKLSYDNLESEVAKSCFLLCGMFPEDAIVSLKTLTNYGLALGIFNNPYINIQEAKYRVQMAVDYLKSSFLLLTEENNGAFITNGTNEKLKMHDLVRDMAILITSKGDDKFWVQSGNGLTEWQPKKHLESYNKISVMGNEISKLPDHELLFPKLDTFLIQDNELSVVPDDFFQHMQKLKVLDMSGNKISSLPRSLEQLKELLMLDLSRNESLCEISILGKLTCLEILNLRETGITEIPKEIGQLTNLRLLDVYDCDLSFVTHGVMSELIGLEELYVRLKKDGDYSFLRELSKLQSLKVLHLRLSKLDYIPEDFHIKTLIEFQIQDDFDHYNKHGCKRCLKMSKTSFPFTMSIMKVIQASEELHLNKIKYLDNILPVCPAGFEELMYLELSECENVRSLVKTCDLTLNEHGKKKTNREIFPKVKEISPYDLNRLEVLFDGPHEYIIFCNLTKIAIYNCESLSELFPLSVAQGLANLREIIIWKCESMTVVISAGDEQTAGVKTDMLALSTISLCYMPKLESFYSGHSIIKYPSLKSIAVEGCPGMNRWSDGDSHMPNLKFKHKSKPYSNINDYIKAELERDKVLNMYVSCRDDTEDEITEE